MSVVGTLSVEFQANLARFIQGTDSANRALSAVGGPETQQNITSTREKIGTLCDQLTGLKSGAEATITAFAGFKLLVEPLASITHGAIETADSIANMSERTGISVQTLSQWRYGAAQSNTTLEVLTDSVFPTPVGVFLIFPYIKLPPAKPEVYCCSASKAPAHREPPTGGYSPNFIWS